MSLFVDSGTGLVLSTYIVHFSPSIEQRNNFIIAKLTVVWCSGGIIYFCTGACKQIADMVKQLNYVWPTAKIPYSGLFLKGIYFWMF